MLLIVGSVILAVLNQVITFMIAKKWRISWILLIAAQVPNSAYDFFTRQYGFIAISFSSTVIAWQAWKSWRPDNPV